MDLESAKLKRDFILASLLITQVFLYCRICEYGEPGLDGCAGNEREEIECNSGPEPEACRPTTTPAPGQGTTTK